MKRLIIINTTKTKITMRFAAAALIATTYAVKLTDEMDDYYHEIADKATSFIDDNGDGMINADEW